MENCGRESIVFVKFCELRLLYRGLMYARKIRNLEIGCFEPSWDPGTLPVRAFFSTEKPGLMIIDRPVTIVFPLAGTNRYRLRWPRQSFPNMTLFFSVRTLTVPPGSHGYRHVSQTYFNFCHSD